MSYQFSQKDHIVRKSFASVIYMWGWVASQIKCICVDKAPLFSHINYGDQLDTLVTKIVRTNFDRENMYNGETLVTDM